jgi:hypothetical protein
MHRPANSNHSPRLGAAFDMWCCETGFLLGRGDLRGRRLDLAARLDALPDAALAGMGIVRADIPRLVFRDLFSN